MGSVEVVHLNNAVRQRACVPAAETRHVRLSQLWVDLIVIAVAALIFFGCILSPPSLMDDVDAVQAQISRNMLDSGDWVTARLDGVKYLEKSPLKYWMIAASFRILGVHDWSARIPIALSAVLLCWLTSRTAAWAFSRRAGLAAGLILATSVGLFLFTRILIPDVTLTLTITLALWAFLRTLDEKETRPLLWSLVCGAAIGAGMLLKGLIAAVFPIGAAVIYLLIARKFGAMGNPRGLRLLPAMAMALAVAAPWHILATLRNPPYFDFSLHSGPGQYRGFFWFYFFNEHLLRFLNLRYPRDYNTVPRLAFWLLHLLWLFPGSLLLPALGKLSYRPVNRAGRMRLLALCWTGFVLVFFTFSSTQEYYSMPVYPALALLLGCALDRGGIRVVRALQTAGAIAVLAGVACLTILFMVRNLPAPGDIAQALTQHPDAYTLSLGHMGDLTLASFAYLRLPLAIAGAAFLAGGLGALLLKGWLRPAALVLMMALFFHSARIALTVFDPYLSSRPLAEALRQAPPGELIAGSPYYTFSSVFFYANRGGYLLNGRVNNLEYGSYAPGAPHVFIDDNGFAALWREPRRYYLLAEGPEVPRLRELAGRDRLHMVAASGGKFLFVNQ